MLSFIILQPIIALALGLVGAGSLLISDKRRLPFVALATLGWVVFLGAQFGDTSQSVFPYIAAVAPLGWPLFERWNWKGLAIGAALVIVARYTLFFVYVAALEFGGYAYPLLTSLPVVVFSVALHRGTADKRTLLAYPTFAGISLLLMLLLS